MSMRINPCSGYLIEAKLLLSLLPVEYAKEAIAAVESADTEDLLSIFEDHLPSSVPTPSSLFVLTDEDEPGSDMEIDIMYAYFEKEDLFEMKETEQMRNLGDLLQVKPQLHSWGVFG